MNPTKAATEETIDCGELELQGVQEFAKEEATYARSPMPRHAHADLLEIEVLTKGIQSIEVADVEYTAMGGDVILVPEREPHSSAMQPRYRTSLFRLAVETRPKTRILGLDKKRSDELVASLCRLKSVQYRGNPELTALIESAFAHLSEKREPSILRGRGELLCFLLSLEEALDGSVGKWRDKTIKAAMEYINDNITQRLELSEIAERIGVSLSYFKAQFRLQTGVSPMYYINWRKIAYAKRLIAHGYSVTDAAMYLNFNSSAYFSTVFRNITSRTPLQYRRIIEEEMRKQQHLWDMSGGLGGD